MTCQLCHGGGADFTFANMDEAHDGMVRDPSAFGDNGCTQCHEADFAENSCDGCHSSDVDAARNSLHTQLWGYKEAISARCECDFDNAGYDEGFTANCAGCHTTCGQCHISRPTSVGGGFAQIADMNYAHRFRRTPHITEQCTACHGSRVGIDFTGALAEEIEDGELGSENVPDVHYSRGMFCVSCHEKEEMHGDPTHTATNHYNNRFEVADLKQCEDCHGSEAGWDNPWHERHVDGTGSKLQCQVCHSQPYKNCTNCHDLSTAEKYNIMPSQVQFKIAHNPMSDLRPDYEYVVVRHTPVDPGTFDDWGLSLPGYDNVPTWKYATPHNIIRVTDQVGEAGSCFSSCHGTDYYLTESDLYEADGTTPLPDYQANIGIVITDKADKK